MTGRKKKGRCSVVIKHTPVTSSAARPLRARLMCDLAREDDPNTTSSNLQSKITEETTVQSCGPNRKESPLPPGADVQELQELYSFIFNDENYLTDTRRNLNENEHDTPNGDTELLCESSDHRSSQIEKTATIDEENCNVTPHPSPKCELNHLDFDCDNHFCPWFVEHYYTAPESSPQSSLLTPNFGILSTPQTDSPISLNTTPESKTRNCSSRKDKGNIRRRHMHEWMDTKRKFLKNLGKEYTSRNGKVRQAKSIKDACRTTCRTRCSETITENERRLVFKKFWMLGDRNKQWSFVTHLVVKNKKRRVLTDMNSRRNFTIKYQLPKHESGELVTVCKTMFLNTLGVSDQFVFTALEKTDKETGLVTPDMRGKHQNHQIKITDEMKNSVCEHIKCIKPVESHYVRQRSSKLYLDGSLTYTRLFELYNEWYDPNKYSCKAQTERQYRDIVNENFKLSFHIPKKDQCDQCHIFKNIHEPSAEERQKYEKHINDKTIARQLKLADKQDAKQSNGKIITATFDFQKVLNAPHGNLSIFYYKRKLSIFNFTIFKLCSKDATCYMWHESEGKRGANEVSSCLLNFIIKQHATGTEEFRFWSDNCVGQNRNRIVYALYMYAAHEYHVNIKHTFLEKGHTQNEGDSVHALIERSSKNKEIYSASEWFCLVRWAKQDEKPYNVVEMTHKDIFDVKELLKGRNWTTNINGQKVYWNKIREVSITADDPFKIHFKYDLSGEASTIIVKSSTRRSKRDSAFSLKALYPRPLPIPKFKKDDLMAMCNSGIIPQRYHDFFTNLPTCSNERRDRTDSEED